MAGPSDRVSAVVVPQSTMPPPLESSTIRDRLANERTLLAWLRTGLGFMGFGMIIARFAWLVEVVGLSATESLEARVVGVIFIVLGTVSVVFGAARTRAYAQLIDPAGRPPANRVLYVSMLIVAALGAALAFGVAIA